MINSPQKDEIIDLNELSKLAKLLATEDIVVQHEPCATASFDTENRVLRLPMWKDLTKPLYHMLCEHEVGHALYTTPAEWKKAIVDQPKIKLLLNIVEDARIERLMKEKFPGSRMDFKIGYETLFNRNFFKTTGRVGSSYSLPDRLNLYFKIGHLYDLPFLPEERKFIRKMEETRSFADVVKVSQELLKYCEENNMQSSDALEDLMEAMAKQKGQGQGEGQPGEGEAEPGDGETGSECSGDVQGEGQLGTDLQDQLDKMEEEAKAGADKVAEAGEEGKDGKPDEKSSNAANQKGSPPPGQQGSIGKMDPGVSNYIDNTKVETVDELEKALSAMVQKAGQRTIYTDIDSNLKNYRDYIISHRDIIDNIRKTRTLSGERYMRLRRKNVNAVDYLVKQFEMRKAATQYRRAQEAKTGVINPSRLHAYKIADDIFKRQTTVTNEKNHGIVMFVDFSGSMANNMHETIEQLINLTMFCRKVKIPHRVYAFTDCGNAFGFRKQSENSRNIWNERDKNVLEAATKFRSDLLIPDRTMNLLELYHEKMTVGDFRDMTEALLMHFGSSQGNNKIAGFNLNGTPLDASVLLAFPLVRALREETNAEIVSAIFLTDGDSGGCFMVSKEHKQVTQGYWLNVNSVIRNQRTGRMYIAKKEGARRTTDLLLKALADENVHVIGYRVGDSRQISGDVHNCVPEDQKQRVREELRKNRCATAVDSRGYEQFHMLVMEPMQMTYDPYSGEQTPTEQAIKKREEREERDGYNFKIAVGATKTQIAKAFSNARNDRMNQRVILSNFIKKIAVSH